MNTLNEREQGELQAAPDLIRSGVLPKEIAANFKKKLDLSTWSRPASN